MFCQCDIKLTDTDKIVNMKMLKTSRYLCGFREKETCIIVGLWMDTSPIEGSGRLKRKLKMKWSHDLAISSLHLPLTKRTSAPHRDGVPLFVLQHCLPWPRGGDSLRVCKETGADTQWGVSQLQ